MKGALGLLEIYNVPHGIAAADAMLKSGDVELLFSRLLCPGKYVLLVGGSVSAVEASVANGKQIMGNRTYYHLIIPNIHPDVYAAIQGSHNFSPGLALGVIETKSLASGILWADAAAKAARIQIVSMVFAMGLSGKAIITIQGEVGAVSSAVQGGKNALRNEKDILDSVILPAPHTGLSSNIF